MIPPKHFNFFPPDWGMLRMSRCVLIFLKTIVFTATLNLWPGTQTKLVSVEIGHSYSSCLFYLVGSTRYCFLLLQYDIYQCYTLLYTVCVCFLPIHSGHQVRWTLLFVVIFFRLTDRKILAPLDRCLTLHCVDMEGCAENLGPAGSMFDSKSSLRTVGIIFLPP